MNGDKHTLKVHGKDYEITIRWECEQECYEDVYGEPPPEGYDYYNPTASEWSALFRD